MLVNGWHANHIFGNWIITEMLFLEFASVGPMLGQADISTLAQRRTNGWITIGMFTGSALAAGGLGAAQGPQKPKVTLLML